MELSANMLKSLRKMYQDDNLWFKSIEQAEAVRMALQRESDILVILPTGGGKTLTYLLPIYMEEDLTTVIVVPYVVLVEQVEQQCKDLNISVQVWRNRGHSIGRTQAIIVAVEHAIMPEFQTLLTVLESTNTLARIVIEECHTLQSHKDFREHIRRVSILGRCVSVPLQFLSATMTPSDVERIRIDFGCHSLKVIRRVEDRKELKYSVYHADEDTKGLEDVNRHIGKYIESKVGSWMDIDRGIIFCL